MSLAAGTRLAHYEILEPIGKGGMGEVYRARDGKLGRDVAIKVLPDEFAENEERLARFKREAKVLASLNHPNIASIYGLEPIREHALPRPRARSWRDSGGADLTRTHPIGRGSRHRHQVNAAPIADIFRGSPVLYG